MDVLRSIRKADDAEARNVILTKGIYEDGGDVLKVMNLSEIAFLKISFPYYGAIHPAIDDVNSTSWRQADTVYTIC